MTEANLLCLRHRTEYRYRRPVALGPHRLILRPRQGKDLVLQSFDVSTSPTGLICWAEDALGNSVATVTFEAPADRLVIESRAEICLLGERWPIYPIDPRAISYPFNYDAVTLADLGRLATAPIDPDGGLHDWAQAFVASAATDTLALLKDLNFGVADALLYEARDAEGTQSGLESLARGRGSCRDLAVLLAEAARCLGFGARVVSGYLYDPDRVLAGQAGSGSTHAWTEIFVPGAGWIPFDPTNRRMGSADLLPVAVGYDLTSIMPVVGSFGGPPEALSSLSVDVTFAAKKGP